MKNKNQNYIPKNPGVVRLLLTTGIVSLLLCCGASFAFAQPKTNVSGGTPPYVIYTIFTVLRESHFVVGVNGNTVNLITVPDGSQKLLLEFNPGDELKSVSDSQTIGDPNKILFLTRDRNTREWDLWYFASTWKSIPVIDLYTPGATCDQVVLSRYGSKVIMVYDYAISILSFNRDADALQRCDRDLSVYTIDPGSVYTNDGETIVYSLDSNDNSVKVISDETRDGNGMKMVAGDPQYGSVLYNWDNTNPTWGTTNWIIQMDDSSTFPITKASFSCIDSNLNKSVEVYPASNDHNYLALYSGTLSNHGVIDIDSSETRGTYPPCKNYVDIVDKTGQIIHYQCDNSTIPKQNNWRFPVVGNYNQYDRIYPTVKDYHDISKVLSTTNSLSSPKKRYIDNSFGKTDEDQYDQYNDWNGCLIVLKLKKPSLK